MNTPKQEILCDRCRECPAVIEDTRRKELNSRFAMLYNKQIARLSCNYCARCAVIMALKYDDIPFERIKEDEE